MNDCEQASRLGAYHDGEMSADCRTDFERHLAQCPICAAELERIRGLARLLGFLPLPQISQSALARMHRKVDALPSTSIRRMAGALAAAAAMVLVVCTIGLARWSPAEGAPIAMPLWEAQAVAQQAAEPASGGSEELLASWMVQDLSARNNND